jgi:type II secretory pathway component GspD/PulD (secretin)
MNRKSCLLMLVTLLAFIVPGRARSEEGNKEDKNGKSSEPLVARIFKLEHQSSETVAKALKHLTSNDRESKLEYSERLDTITVRDRPNHLAAIAQAIKQLDVATPDVSFQIRVLVAGQGGETSVPADMQKVVRQLQQNLQFKVYQQVAAITQRVRSGSRLSSEGSIELVPPMVEKSVRANYEIDLKPVVTGARRGARTVQVRSLNFKMQNKEIGNAEIRTDVVIPEGETVVVGTAAMGTRALVLVVWATTI